MEFFKDLDIDGMSSKLKSQYEQVKDLVDKIELTDEEKEEINNNLEKFRKEFDKIKF